MTDDITTEERLARLGIGHLPVPHNVKRFMGQRMLVDARTGEPMVLADYAEANAFCAWMEGGCDD